MVWVWGVVLDLGSGEWGAWSGEGAESVRGGRGGGWDCGGGGLVGEGGGRQA